MSAIEPNTLAIDFSDKVFKEQPLFDYSDNALYNLSCPLFAIVLTLSRLPKPENLALFKGLLKQHIVDLSEQGKALDYPSAVIDKLCCLHCIVLDEFIIHSIWGTDAGWENNTLLSELFGLKNGGDLFFTVSDKALRQSNKMSDLLEVIYVFLQMGFKGRYRSREAEQIGLITKEVKAAISEKITPADVLVKDRPVVKTRILINGARYISFTLIVIITLAVVIGFFDYWFKETYELRARQLTELKEQTSKHILNQQSKDITYISTAEDIQLVKHLTQRQAQHTQENTVSDKAHSPVHTEPTSKSTEKPETKTTSSTAAAAQYRVQLASFSRSSNAQSYLATLNASPYPLAIMELTGYFIVFTSADSLLQAEKQRDYFKENYQLTAIINQVDASGEAQ